MSQRHATDVISLVFGVIFAGFTVVWLLQVTDAIDAGQAWVVGPVVLMAAGPGLVAALRPPAGRMTISSVTWTTSARAERLLLEAGVAREHGGVRWSASTVRQHPGRRGSPRSSRPWHSGRCRSRSPSAGTGSRRGSSRCAQPVLRRAVAHQCGRLCEVAVGVLGITRFLLAPSPSAYVEIHARPSGVTRSR